MSDSKLPDFQGGAEHAANVSSAALAGANIIYESVECGGAFSAHALKAFSDNDILERRSGVQRELTNQEPRF